MAQDLATMLDRASERPPFILVGWSFGGLVIRVFRSEHPDLVAGMVLVDASSTHQFAGADPQLEGETKVDLDASGRRAQHTQPLGDLPLVVLTEGELNQLPRFFRPKWLRWQDEMAKLSTNSIHVTATKSGHEILNYQPELIAQAVRDIKTSSDDHAPIPPCDTRYTRIDGRCDKPSRRPV